MGPSGRLQINLSAVRHNWRELKEHFTGSDCGAVVKADAYGLGYAPVVQALFSEGCRSFYVATYDEALEVRKLLANRARIYVLQGCPAGLEREFLNAKLIPVIISAHMLARWCEQAKGHDAPCAVKVNTGMNRLGLDKTEFSQWITQPERWASAYPTVLMSHMACADTPDHPLNEQQLKLFKELLGLARDHYPELKASLANSASLYLGDAWHFDMARPGIALYGGREGVRPQADIRPVVTLSLPVLQVRDVKAGDSIGYGATYRAAKAMPVAIVAGGYGDGVLRSLGNCVAASYAGHNLPLVGRVSMDSCALDLSSLPESQRPREGQFIEIFGPHRDLTSLAEGAGTISYELLTRLGGRLKKHYIEPL